MVHIVYDLAPSDRQDRALRHSLEVQRNVYRWLKGEFATYPNVGLNDKTKALGKAFTKHKRSVPMWSTVYSAPLNDLVYRCFYKGGDFDPTSIRYPAKQGWKLGTDLAVSKVVSTIKITKRPYLHSYGPRIPLPDVGTPATLRLTLAQDEWRADVGVNTGDRAIAICTWDSACGHILPA